MCANAEHIVKLLNPPFPKLFGQDTPSVTPVNHPHLGTCFKHGFSASALLIFEAVLRGGRLSYAF